MLVQVALVLTMVSCGIWVVISARRRSWADLTLAVCILLNPVLSATELGDSVWANVIVAAVAVVSAILLVRERWRDPEWRASWTK